MTTQTITKTVTQAELEGKVPAQAWVTTFSGTAVNLCLGILYAWSIWKSALVNVDLAGQPMSGVNEGWLYLTNAQAATPYSLCAIIFALFMIPGGKIQDRISPAFGATVGGLLLAAGCILAGFMKSYTGLILGFGVLGGAGMGIGYAAPTPAALKWFGPEKRGLIAGLVVGGYGGAALYISYLGQYFIDSWGISGSFYALGALFCIVVIIAGQLLKTPPEGYTPPVPMSRANFKLNQATEKTHDWEAGDVLRTWQLYALIFMFILTTQSGLLIISSAKGLMATTAKGMPFFVTNAWLLVSFGGLINASGRVGTGYYSDRIGRLNAYCINCSISALCLFSLPYVISTQNIFLLFLVVGIAYWQYGGGLALMPSFTADFFGSKNLGFNYGLVFLGWGLGVFIARIGGMIQDVTGSLNYAFYLSGGLLILGVILAKLTTKPVYNG